MSGCADASVLADGREVYSSDSTLFHVSELNLVVMDLPSPHVLEKAREGHVFRIAVVVTATGTYRKHVPGFAAAAYRYLCTDHHVTLFVLSDGRVPLQPPLDRFVVWLNISSPPSWPFPTLKRPHFALSHWARIKEFEYVFMMDVDLLFVRPVGLEVLDISVASYHPGVCVCVCTCLCVSLLCLCRTSSTNMRGWFDRGDQN